MNISQQYVNRLQHGRNEHFLADDSGAATHAEVLDAWDMLDRHWGNELAAAHCVQITARNVIADVAMILYCFARKVNCFLSSPQVAAPPFCDKIVTIQPGGPGIGQLAGSMRVIANAGYAGSEATVPGAGVVLFATSGTTGMPKFIQFSQEKLWANARNFMQRLPEAAERSCCIPVPVTHMYGMGAGLLPAILGGASVVLLQHNNIVRLYDRLARHKPGIALLTPALCKMTLAVRNPAARAGWYISAGEPLPPNTRAAFAQACGPLINLYGCTELGAVATSAGAGASDTDTAGELYALSGVEVRIDQSRMGEIMCRHAFGFDHYVTPEGQPAQPGDHEPGWHPMRDRGVMTAGNGFIVEGRLDNCINRLGFLVSTEQIEMEVERLLIMVKKAVVFAIPEDNLTGHVLLAVCEVQDHDGPDAGAARNICREKLPNHLLPDLFCFVNSLPRLPNGKPDRQSLRNHYSSISHNECQ